MAPGLLSIGEGSLRFEIKELRRSAVPTADSLAKGPFIYLFIFCVTDGPLGKVCTRFFDAAEMVTAVARACRRDVREPFTRPRFRD